VIRDQARDEAIAIAKAYSHSQVELRHVLWGLVRALGADAPAEVPAAAVRALLEPSGSSFEPPTVSEAAEHALGDVTSFDSATAKIIDLARQLGVGGPAPDAASTRQQTKATADHDIDSKTDSDASADDAPHPDDTTESVLAELDALIGLGAVKQEVRRLIAVQRLNTERRTAGLPEVNPSHHVVFTGAPGTGKTTVARLIGRLYGTIGVVSKGHLVEATRADLVAGYVGQTALKVKEIVSRAIGGVLFIDEAYSLASDEAVDFGREAIATLVQSMEENRRDLAVIVAGYPDEMRHFIDSNPGLRSRFTHYIAFPDYSAPELVEIFEGFAATAKVGLGAGVKEQLAGLFTSVLEVGNFGNARFVRSVFEGAYANMATRALADDRIDRAEMDEMAAADLPVEVSQLANPAHRIGFQPR